MLALDVRVILALEYQTPAGSKLIPLQITCVALIGSLIQL